MVLQGASLSHHQFLPDKAVLTLTELRKQDRPHHKGPNQVVPPLEGDRSLWPVETLNSYLNIHKAS